MEVDWWMAGWKVALICPRCSMAAACLVEGWGVWLYDIGEPDRRTSSGLMLLPGSGGSKRGRSCCHRGPSLSCRWSMVGRGARNIRSPAQHSLHVRVSDGDWCHLSACPHKWTFHTPVLCCIGMAAPCDLPQIDGLVGPILCHHQPVGQSKSWSNTTSNHISQTKITLIIAIIYLPLLVS